MEILQEQFAGLIIFSFTLSTFISNIEARIFLDTQCLEQQPVTKFNFILFYKKGAHTKYI